jgi:hypothetical protein
MAPASRRFVHAALGNACSSPLSEIDQAAPAGVGQRQDRTCGPGGKVGAVRLESMPLDEKRSY